MAGIKISDLNELSTADATDSDLLVIVDVSSDETKKIRYETLLASNVQVADKADRILIESKFGTYSADERFNILFSPIATDQSQWTSEHTGGVTGYDSVGYDQNRLYYNADAESLYAHNGIRTSGDTGRLGGIADEAPCCGLCEL